MSALDVKVAALELAEEVAWDAFTSYAGSAAEWRRLRHAYAAAVRATERAKVLAEVEAIRDQHCAACAKGDALYVDDSVVGGEFYHGTCDWDACDCEADRENRILAALRGRQG